MSLLIEGMDMPKDYKHRDVTLDRTTDDGILRLSVCDFDHEAREYSCRVYPLTEIPKPHGRLIDADRLIVALKNSVFANAFFHTPALTVSQIEHLIERQPTVIEKEMS